MSDVGAYIAALPEPRRERGEALHRLVLERYPHAEVSLRYRMPTYHVGENFFAWGNQKRQLSVYTCSAQRIAGFRARYPEVPAGVGCLNFRDRDEFPLAALAAVVRNALAPSAALLARERRAAEAARAGRG